MCLACILFGAIEFWGGVLKCTPPSGDQRFSMDELGAAIASLTTMSVIDTFALVGILTSIPLVVAALRKCTGRAMAGLYVMCFVSAATILVVPVLIVADASRAPWVLLLGMLIWGATLLWASVVEPGPDQTDSSAGQGQLRQGDPSS